MLIQPGIAGGVVLRLESAYQLGVTEPRQTSSTRAGVKLLFGCLLALAPALVRAATPGEAGQLTVTGYDDATGNIS